MALKGGPQWCPLQFLVSLWPSPRQAAGRTAGSLMHSHQPAQEPDVGQADLAANPR